MPPLVLVGIVIGYSTFLAAWAGLCFRSLWTGIAAASLMLIAAFATYIYFASRTTQEFVRGIVYACSFPSLVVCGITPLFLVRWWGRRLSPNSVNESPVVWSLESVFHWTSLIACTLYLVRIPILVSEGKWQGLAVFLGTIAVSACVASLFVVVPSACFLFRKQTSLASWLFALLLTTALVALLVPIAIVIMFGWRSLSLENSKDLAVSITCSMGIYYSGLLALHWRGYRWIHVKSQMTESQNTGEEAHRFYVRLTTVAFIGFAILVKSGLDRHERTQRNLAAGRMSLFREFRAMGADVGLTSDRKTINRLTLSDSNFEGVLPKLPKPIQLSTVKLEGMSPTQLEIVISSIDHCSGWTLEKCELTEATFSALDRFQGVHSLHLVHCRFPIEPLAKTLRSTSLRTVEIADSGLTDEQFDLIYQPSIRDWRLAGNRLTDRTLLKIWENFDVAWIDLSQNPITSDGLSQLPPPPFVPASKGIGFVAREIPLDDKVISMLIQTKRIGSITLGQTQATTAGLDRLLSAGITVTLLNDCFEDDQLAAIDPAMQQGQWFTVTGKSFTAKFLKQWSQIPNNLNLSDTSLTDEIIVDLADGLAVDSSLVLQGTQISDACLESLQQASPVYIDFRNTGVTGAGLLKYPMPKTSIVIDDQQATTDQIRKLRSLFGNVSVIW